MKNASYLFEKAPKILLTLGFFISLFVFSNFNIALYQHLEFSGFDFGTFIQSVWYAASGELPNTSTNFPFDAERPWLSFHFSVTHLLLAPFFALFGADPTILCIAHVLAIHLTVFPLYFGLKKAGLSPKLCIFWAVLFLFNPVTLNTLTYSLSDHSLAVPLMACCLCALTYRHFGYFLLSCFLLTLCKEHYGIAAFGLSLLWAYHYPTEKKKALFTALGFFSYTLIIIGWVMPALGAESHSMLLSMEELKEDKYKMLSIHRYAWLGLPWPDNLGTFLYLLTSGNTWSYLFQLLSVSGFLALGAPLFLLASGADLAANILSTSGVPRNFGYYHSSAIIPVLIFASASDKNLIMQRLQKHKALLTSVLSVLFLYNIVLCSLVIAKRQLILSTPRAGVEHIGLQSEGFRKAAEHIPADAAVTTSAGLEPFFAGRKEIYNLGYGSNNAEYAIFLLAQPDFTRYPYALSMAKIVPTKSIRALLNSHWQVEHWDAPWLVLRKNTKKQNSNHTSVLLTLEKLEQLQQEAFSRQK